MSLASGNAQKAPHPASQFDWLARADDGLPNILHTQTLRDYLVRGPACECLSAIMDQLFNARPPDPSSRRREQYVRERTAVSKILQILPQTRTGDKLAARLLTYMSIPDRNGLPAGLDRQSMLYQIACTYDVASNSRNINLHGLFSDEAFRRVVDQGVKDWEGSHQNELHISADSSRSHRLNQLLHRHGYLVYEGMTPDVRILKKGHIVSNDPAHTRQ